MQLKSSLYFVFTHLKISKLLPKADFGHFGNVQIYVSDRLYLYLPMRISAKIYKLLSREPKDYI